MTIMNYNYYEFIGVKQDATDDEIKDACRRRLLENHPDTCKDVYVDDANDITKLVLEIKGVLLDSDKRKAYDRTLSKAHSKGPNESLNKYYTCDRCGGIFSAEYILYEKHGCSSKCASGANNGFVYTTSEKPMCPVKNEMCYDNLDCDNCDDPKIKRIKARELKEKADAEYKRKIEKGRSEFNNPARTVNNPTHIFKKKDSIFDKIKNIFFK